MSWSTLPMRGMNDYYANGPHAPYSSRDTEEIELCPDCNESERDCECHLEVLDA